MYLKVHYDSHGTGCNKSKGLVVPLVAIRECIAGCYPKENKEDHQSHVDTLCQTTHKYHVVEIEVLLPSDVKLGMSIAAVLVHVLIEIFIAST